jgi:hypothetical protein
MQSITWGQCDRQASQGWMIATGNGYWSASWSGTHNTHERDGKVSFDGKVWRSERSVNISIPCAVMDDYGFLMPLAVKHWPHNLNKLE